MGDYGSIILLVGMFAVFYFLLIRPQQKRQKEHEEMLSKLRMGDRVITQGGILGKIAGFSDPFVVLEVSEKVKMRVLRSSIARKHGSEEEK